MVSGKWQVRLGAGAICAALALAPVAQAQELHVLNWKGWGTDEDWAVSAFEEQTGAKIVHDYITSYPEVFTKLYTNPGYYDVVILNAAFVGQAAEEGLIDPVDMSHIPNAADLFPDMRDSSQVVFDGTSYAVAWLWGVTSLVYNTDKFAVAPDTLEVLWDPANAGRVCWRDDPEDSVRFAALALGQNPDAPEDLETIGDKLKALKPQVRSFWKSEDEWRKMIAAKECDLSVFWTASLERAVAEDHFPVAYAVPKEGAIAFRDTLVFPAGSANRELAETFVNYLISPEFYQGWQQAGGAPLSANARAVDALPADSDIRNRLTTPEALARMNFKGPLSEEQRRAYLDLWQETKAHFAR